MRALKTLLIIVLALVGLVLVLSFIGPSTTVVERSTVIAASPEVIYPMVSDLRAGQAWSPWVDIDRDQVVTYEGEDGAMHSTMSWAGDTVGKGTQRITELEENKHMGAELKFTEPWESTSKVDIDLEKTEAGTEVTWRMSQENDFMGRVMGVFMNMDKMVGPQFETGLAKLKGLSEEKASMTTGTNFRGFEIATVDRPEMTYIGVRKELGWNELPQQFATVFPKAVGAAQKAGMEMTGPPSGLYFTWDEANQRTDMMAGIPIAGDASTKVADLQTHVIPASKALFIEYHGAYEGSGEAHMAMDDMIKANGLTHRSVALEEYVTDPMTEPDTTKWVTNIYYPID